MTTGWGCHPVLIFLPRMNRIGSIVELEIYIRVQEEDIRVEEEFVSKVIKVFLDKNFLTVQILTYLYSAL